MIFEGHILFKIIVKVYKKMLGFFGKTFNFLTKICLLTFCIFCLIKEVLNHQLYLRKCIENIFYILSQKKTKNKTKEAKIRPNFINHHFWKFWNIITTCFIKTHYHTGFSHFFTTFTQTLIKFLKTKVDVKIQSCYCYFK